MKIQDIFKRATHEGRRRTEKTEFLPIHYITLAQLNNEEILFLRNFTRDQLLDMKVFSTSSNPHSIYAGNIVWEISSYDLDQGNIEFMG